MIDTKAERLSIADVVAKGLDVARMGGVPEAQQVVLLGKIAVLLCELIDETRSDAQPPR